MGRGTASYAERKLRGLRRAGMMTMSDDAPKPPEVDDAYLAQWFEYGYKEMCYYLLKVARLDAYEARHPRVEEPDGAE